MEGLSDWQNLEEWPGLSGSAILFSPSRISLSKEYILHLAHEDEQAGRLRIPLSIQFDFLVSKAFAHSDLKWSLA